jgi:hypothetical protein
VSRRKRSDSINRRNRSIRKELEGEGEDTYK